MSFKKRCEITSFFAHGQISLHKNPSKEKDPPSRRVFISKKLYLMKKIITFKLSVQNYCQNHIWDPSFALKKVKPQDLISSSTVLPQYDVDNGSYVADVDLAVAVHIGA